MLPNQKLSAFNQKYTKDCETIAFLLSSCFYLYCNCYNHGNKEFELNLKAPTWTVQVYFGSKGDWYFFLFTTYGKIYYSEKKYALLEVALIRQAYWH